MDIPLEQSPIMQNLSDIIWQYASIAMFLIVNT
jgi:hypothetical protein